MHLLPENLQLWDAPLGRVGLLYCIDNNDNHDGDDDDDDGDDYNDDDDDEPWV